MNIEQIRYQLFKLKHIQNSWIMYYAFLSYLNQLPTSSKVQIRPNILKVYVIDIANLPNKADFAMILSRLCKFFLKPPHLFSISISINSTVCCQINFPSNPIYIDVDVNIKSLWTVTIKTHKYIINATQHISVSVKIQKIETQQQSITQKSNRRDVQYEHFNVFVGFQN